jgi:hypothetical protein
VNKDKRKGQGSSLVPQTLLECENGSCRSR